MERLILVTNENKKQKKRCYIKILGNEKGDELISNCSDKLIANLLIENVDNIKYNKKEKKLSLIVNNNELIVPLRLPIICRRWQ